MNHTHAIQFASGLEHILDERLFRSRPEDDPNSVNHSKTVGGAVLACGLAVGGIAGSNAVRRYANSAGVNDRLSGLRITRPGFAQLSPNMQRVRATVSRAGTDIAGGAATAAQTVSKEALYRGRGLYNSAENAGLGALKKSKPFAKSLLARIGGLATAIK